MMLSRRRFLLGAPMAVLVPPSQWQEFTSLGALASGHKLFFYRAGTASKQDTYADAGGLTANANPVVLDLRGEANVWLDGSKLYRVVLAAPTDTDPPRAPLRTMDNVGVTAQGLSFLQFGTGAVPAPARSKMAETVSIGDFGGSPGATAAANAAALNAAIAYLTGNFGGGRVLVPKGAYNVAGSSVALPANIWLQGDSSAASYDTVNLAGGTTFTFTTGDWGIRQHGRHARLSNIRLSGAGGRVAYGLVVTGVAAIVESVSASYFEYGIVGANLNSVRFDNILCLLNSKIGFTVLPNNSGGVGAFAYPKIAPLIGTTASTIFTIGGNSRFQSNRIGMALLSGYCATISGVSESNQYYGLIIFKRNGVCDHFKFVDWWQEDDGTVLSPKAWNLAGIEALKTSPTEYLKGDVSGEWGPEDYYAGIWMGSETEGWDQGGNETRGPPTGVTFEHCRITPNAGLFRLRSQRKLLLDRCTLQSANGNTAFSATVNSYKLKIREPVASVLGDQIRLMRVPGTYTTYEIEDTQVRGAVSNAASAAWTDLVDVTLMSPHNKYVFSIAPPKLFSACGAQGYVFYDGTDVVVVKERTGSDCDVRISGGKLQYQHRAGRALSYRWKVFCRGSLEFT